MRCIEAEAEESAMEASACGSAESATGSAGGCKGSAMAPASITVEYVVLEIALYG